ncbi:MAG: class I SAM-dependent methyltransferase [Gemmatimonadota bacterium]|jgi:SAM-dependent methyltransferase
METTGVQVGLEEVRRVFEEWGRRDPMHAALTRRGYEDGGWDVDAFFARGRKEIAAVVDYVRGLGLEPGRGRALDFGCGPGRLTHGLAAHFREVDGVDISASMVAAARRHNRHGDRVRFSVNTTAELALFPDDRFDFVYTNKVLQHIPPEAQIRYVREFVRVLRPGGLAVFQMRNGPRIEPGTVRAWLYTAQREYFRRFWKRLRGKPAYEMHFLARSRVEEAVAAAGGDVIDVVDLSRSRRNRSLRYCVRKADRTGAESA